MKTYEINYICQSFLIRDINKSFDWFQRIETLSKSLPSVDSIRFITPNEEYRWNFVSLNVINALNLYISTESHHYLTLTYKSVSSSAESWQSRWRGNVPTNLGPCRDTIRVASERSTNERVWLSGRWFIAVISACSSSREGRPTLQGKPGARSRSRAEKLVPVSESGLTEFKIITARLKSLSHALSPLSTSVSLFPHTHTFCNQTAAKGWFRWNGNAAENE